MAGIERIKIISSWSDRNTEISNNAQQLIDESYRKGFLSIGMELMPGTESIIVTKQAALARYDFIEGIDIIFNFVDGTKGTAQEKVLTFFKDTATFEIEKKDGKPGAWFYCTSQYYFVCYLAKLQGRVDGCISLQRKNREGELITEYFDVKNRLRSAIMLNLADMHRLSMLNKIPWAEAQEAKRLGRNTKFINVPFKSIPESAIIFKL